MKQTTYFFSHLSVTAILILITVILVVSLVQLFVLTAKIKLYYKIVAILTLQFFVFLFFKLFYQYSLTVHTVVLVFSAFFSAILWALTSKTLFSLEGKIDPIWSVRFPIKNSKDLIILNIKRGMAIFGSSGSGKTESGFVPIIKHTGDRNIPCLCYDYKDGELTEIALYFYRNSNINFAIIIHLFKVGKD